MDFLTVDDGERLSYRLDGPENAPVLALVHALGTNLGVWAPQMDALSARFRVLRHDMRGHGRSALSPGPVTIERLGRDLLALFDRLDIMRAHVCGLSLGGMVTLWLAAQHPERVDRAVLADTAARIGSVDSWEERIAQVRSGGMASIREAAVARFLGESYRLGHPDVARALGEMLEATSPAGYIAACAALRDADLRPSIDEIRTPSLIIVGALDPSTPPAQSRELHEAIRGSELEIIDAAAHLSNVEQAAVFTDHLLRFLDVGGPQSHRDEDPKRG
jgi:3-oxoadipate enol-lactonase